jgi:hypothetical protein
MMTRLSISVEHKGRLWVQAVKFVHWQERPMFLSKAEVRPRLERAIAAIPLDGFVIVNSACGGRSKRPLRTRRRMGGRTILR